MSDKTIKTSDIPREQLEELWEDTHKNNMFLKQKNIILSKEIKFWRDECKKYERFYHQIKKKLYEE